MPPPVLGVIFLFLGKLMPMTLADILREAGRLCGTNRLSDDPILSEFAVEHANGVQEEIARDMRLLAKDVTFGYNDTMTLPTTARWMDIEATYIDGNRYEPIPVLPLDVARARHPDYPAWTGTTSTPRFIVYDPALRGSMQVSPPVSRGTFRIRYFKRPDVLDDTSDLAFDGQHEDYHMMLAYGLAVRLLELDFFGGPASEQGNMGGNSNRLQLVRALFEREKAKADDQITPIGKPIGRPKLWKAAI
jgi:hypothetical protein